MAGEQVGVYVWGLGDVADHDFDHADGVFGGPFGELESDVFIDFDF